MSYPIEETFTCVNCGAVYSLEIIEEGDKATEPLVEFCPVCGLHYDINEVESE